MAWQRGYVSDLSYLSGFFDVTAPAHMRAVQLLSGQRPKPADARFRCLEIGSGTSVGLAIIAAANPQAEFVAIDYHPGQVAVGRELARAGGLDNLKVIEADLVDVAPRAAQEFGEFDYLICHGVYTWVGDPVRQAIVETLRQCSAPGALVYLGYNSLPGWSTIGPMQKLLSEFANASHARSDDRIRNGIGFLKEVAARGARHIDTDQLPALGRKKISDVDEISPELVRYLAHEYLTDHWRPAYHVDIARTLGEAKLTFVNSATVSELFIDMVATDEQQALINAQPPGPLREQLKDFFSPPMFRRDIFVRGATPIAETERARLLDETHLHLLGDPEKFPYKIDCRLGQAELPRQSYEIIVRKLAAGPCPIGELRGELAAKGHILRPEEICGIMLASNQAAILHAPDAAADNATLRFNKAMAEFALTDMTAHNLGLAARKLQNGRHASRAEYIFYHLHASGEIDNDVDIVAQRAEAAFERFGESLIEDGAAVDDPARRREILRDYVTGLLPERLKYWQGIGAA